MAGIGTDIAKVLEELGTPVDVYKYSTGVTTREYLDPDDTINASNPFASEFFLRASLPYSTSAEEGDLITYAETPRQEKFLVVTLTESYFEGSSIVSEGLFYKTNSVAQIKRKVETRDPDTYALTSAWNCIDDSNVSGEYVLFVGATSDAINTTEPINFVIQQNIMYISKFIDVQVNDRCVIRASRDLVNEVSGESYIVTDIESYRFPGVHICQVREDNRE